MSRQHGRPMGRFAGYNVISDLLGEPMLSLRIPWYVTVLDLGPAGAVYTEGWDRQVIASGAEAKATKRTINGRRIYPPSTGAVTRSSPPPHRRCSRGQPLNTDLASSKPTVAPTIFERPLFRFDVVVGSSVTVLHCLRCLSRSHVGSDRRERTPASTGMCVASAVLDICWPLGCSCSPG